MSSLQEVKPSRQAPPPAVRKPRAKAKGPSLAEMDLVRQMYREQKKAAAAIPDVMQVSVMMALETVGDCLNHVGNEVSGVGELANHPRIYEMNQVIRVARDLHQKMKGRRYLTANDFVADIYQVQALVVCARCAHGLENTACLRLLHAAEWRIDAMMAMVELAEAKSGVAA